MRAIMFAVGAALLLGASVSPAKKPSPRPVFVIDLVELQPPLRPANNFRVSLRLKSATPLAGPFSVSAYVIAADGRTLAQNGGSFQPPRPPDNSTTPFAVVLDPLYGRQDCPTALAPLLEVQVSGAGRTERARVPYTIVPATDAGKPGTCPVPSFTIAPR